MQFLTFVPCLFTSLPSTRCVQCCRKCCTTPASSQPYCCVYVRVLVRPLFQLIRKPIFQQPYQSPILPPNQNYSPTPIVSGTDRSPQFWFLLEIVGATREKFGCPVPTKSYYESPYISTACVYHILPYLLESSSILTSLPDNKTACLLYTRTPEY